MPDLIHCIDAAAPPGVLYPLVSKGEGFRSWWAEDVVETPGGTVELGFFGRTTIYHLRALSLEPERRAEWLCESGQEWSGTLLVFELEALKAGTRIRFTHAGWAAATEYFISCNTTWGGLMFRLKAAAEGRAPGPLFRASSMAY
jgi:Activator of Hsp90 ATPase homolog 1-like protein